MAEHDGNLGDDYTVYHSSRLIGGGGCIRIDGKWAAGANGEDSVSLSPAQALSLLAWLRQEEAELQRLADK